MHRFPTFALGLIVGCAACGSVAALRANLQASPPATASATAPSPVGHYQISYGGASMYMVDTTNGRTWRMDVVQGKWKWLPDTAAISP